MYLCMLSSWRCADACDELSVRVNFYLGAMAWAEYNEDLKEAGRLFGLIKELIAKEEGGPAIIAKIMARHAGLKAEIEARKQAAPK